jgi:hypothetical protein
MKLRLTLSINPYFHAELIAAMEKIADKERGDYLIYLASVGLGGGHQLMAPIPVQTAIPAVQRNLPKLTTAVSPPSTTDRLASPGVAFDHVLVDVPFSESFGRPKQEAR